MRKIKITYMTVWEFLTRIIDLIGLFMAMFLSELLLENIVFGGALYITGEVWVTYARLYNKKTFSLLPSNVRNRGLVIFIVSAVLTVALVLLYPYIQSEPTVLVLVLLIAGFILQQIVTDSVATHMPPGTRRRALVLALAHILFLAAYAVLFYFNHLLLQYDIPGDIGTLYVAAILTSVVLYVCQLLNKPAPDAEPEPEPMEGDRLMDVHSYRIYNKMTVNTFVAINLSIMAFICYMRFLPYTGFLYSALLLCLWLAFIGLVTVIAFCLLQRSYLARYDRPVIFLAGLVFWGAAAAGTLRNFWGSGMVGTLVNSAFMGASIACMLSIILVQSYEMKTVIELGVGKIDDGAYERNTSVMLDWSSLMSYLLMLVMLVIASFIMDGKFDQIEATLGMQKALQLIMLVLPMCFVLASMVYSLMQPLDKNYAEKLRKYTRQMEKGEQNPPLENRLKKMLVTNYPRQIAVQILKPLARPFLPCKVYGKENVDLSQGPVIFVCNHMEIYGPILAVLYSPFYFRPWVIQSMLDKDVIAEHMRSGVDKVFGFLPKGFRHWLMYKVVPVVIWIMNSMDPIPVYRGTVRGVIQTIQLSVEAMEYDDNILLFPEINYQEAGVGEFFTGFVQVAKSYHKQTGKCATFYPMYIDKKNHRMTYGEGITFNPGNGSGEEKERIVDYLKAHMNEMAGNPEGAQAGQPAQ